MTIFKDSWPDPDFIDEFTGRWDWCDHCGIPIISCMTCGHNSCDGGGCDLCHNDFEKAMQMIRNGTAPTRELTERPARIL